MALSLSIATNIYKSCVSIFLKYYRIAVILIFVCFWLAEDSSGLLIKIGDSGGGQYTINYGNVFTSLACATLDSIVLERFGSKAARLFRYVFFFSFLRQTRVEKYSIVG